MSFKKESDILTYRIISTTTDEMLEEARRLAGRNLDTAIYFPDTVEGRKALLIFAAERLYRQ